MNYWIHRISHLEKISYPLLEKGYLSIGFSDFSNQESFIDNVLEGNTPAESIKKEFDKNDIWRKLGKINSSSVSAKRGNLRRFIGEFKKGDKIVIPIKGTGTFHVYKITSEKPQIIGDLNEPDLKDLIGNEIKINTNNNLLQGNDEVIDLGFFWKVESIVKFISKDKYADGVLTKKFRPLITNFNITSARDSVEEAINASENNQPINLHSELIESIIPKIIDKIKSELNPDKFEALVKWYFERIGANDVYHPAKNERDKEGVADVVATFDPIKTIIYTQVKFHEGETGSHAVNQIIDYVDKKEEMDDDDYTKISWVISSAESFQKETIILAKTKNVQLIDMNEFAKMLFEVGIYNLDKALNK